MELLKAKMGPTATGIAPSRGFSSLAGRQTLLVHRPPYQRTSTRFCVRSSKGFSFNFSIGGKPSSSAAATAVAAPVQVTTAGTHLPSWADVLPAGDTSSWTSLSALLTIPSLSNATKYPSLALALVSEAGKVTPWTLTTDASWKSSPFSGESKTASRASTIKEAYKLEGELRVPPDFGPVGGLLVYAECLEESQASFNFKDLLEKIFGNMHKDGSHPLEETAFVDTVTLSPPSSPAASTTPGLTIPVHSYLFPQQKTRIFLARAAPINGADIGGNPAAPALLPYRLADLQVTRGEITSLDDPTRPEQGNYQPWQRIYQYDVYNDLGVDHLTGDPALRRPTLGGKQLPYPRRIKTGRPLTKDRETESAPRSGEPYLPLNERFTPIRKGSFLGNTFANAATAAVNVLRSAARGPRFTSVHEVRKWFNDAPAASMEESQAVQDIIKEAPGNPVRNFRWPSPAVMEVEIKGKKVWRPDMWRDDAEFGRQVVAGCNPVAMKVVTTLDGTAFTGETVPPELTGFTPIEELAAAAAKDPVHPRLFQLDYNTIFNDLAGSQKWKEANIKNRAAFGSRALLYADDQGGLRPVAVELQAGVGTPKEVFTPLDGVGVWMLAKLFVGAADSAFHQVASHWLRSHAVVEPIVVASRRRLSLAHPIGRLLQKHFTYNLQLNALARTTLVNAGGLVEKVFSFAERFSMELGALVYGATWRFDHQAVPADLVARGVALEDKAAPGGVKLVEGLDQPFATDALALWNLMHGWVHDYVNLYYKSDADVVADAELVGGEVQAHPDITVGWPALDGRASLVNIVTTIIWLASGYHAAVNFGQYDFIGLLPSRPSLITKPFPARDSDEFKLLAWGADYEEMERRVLSYVSPPAEYATVLTIMAVLSKHDEAEQYLGENDPWVLDLPAVDRFKQFAADLKQLEDDIKARNVDPKLVNRCGDFVVPYTLLIPSSGPGVTRRGVPNSICI